ncbi:DUF624 domain-containing protein [Alkalihalobacillus oceani]|uniref:YesL family protein n=1 Tax=Halalkalibacter oceani TaxID=1653776 RepID=UPI00203BEB95|nr:DUF624 domain-containing protein [Halalkalibacter oceani]MCM3762878.1 DUF624 domain-containing protein [Halalkalibacter oceani]
MEPKGLTGLLFRGMEWLTRLAALNLTWLLYSLPVFTVIPATAALFDVIYKWEVEGRDLPVYQTFKASFKQHFGTSYKVGVPLCIIGFIIGIDLWFIDSLGQSWMLVFKYMLYTLTVVFLLFSIYCFPIYVRLQRSWYKVYMAALVVSLSRPFVSIVLLFQLLILGAVLLYWPSLLLFFSMSVPGLLASKAVALTVEKYTLSSRVL